MGWEKRGGKLVYYRKERFKDEQGRSRVRSIHFGSGVEAEAAAREDEARRANFDELRRKKGAAEQLAQVSAKKRACATGGVTQKLHVKKGGVTNIGHVKKETPPFRNPPDWRDRLTHPAFQGKGPVTAGEIVERGMSRASHFGEAAKVEREQLLGQMVGGSVRDFRLGAAYVGLSESELDVRGIERPSEALHLSCTSGSVPFPDKQGSISEVCADKQCENSAAGDSVLHPYGATQDCQTAHLKKGPITLEEVCERAAGQQAGAYRSASARRMFLAGNINGACALAEIPFAEVMERNIIC
jgi:hypothetical protein